MQDNPRSEPTPEEIKHLLQEAILRNYPNPERRGCFDRSTIRSVAAERLPHERPEWEHISHCSPCYQEFLEHRAEFLDEKRTRRRLAVAAGGAIAAVALITIIWLAGVRSTPSAPKVPSNATRRSTPSPTEQNKSAKTLTAVLNMQAVPTRGVESPNESRDLQRLPRGQMAPLLIYLPFGTDEGTYKADLYRDDKGSVPLATFSGTAHIRDGLTVLELSPDLSSFAAGTYVLSVSRESGSVWNCRFVLS
jgi:hypothetical protein